MQMDHITINVTDMQASEAFYGRALGLAKLHEVDMGDHRLHYFDLGKGALLELIQYDDPDAEIHPDNKSGGIFRHLASGSMTLRLSMRPSGLQAPVFSRSRPMWKS